MQNQTMNLNVRLTEELINKIDEQCKLEHRSRSNIARIAIEYYLNHKEKGAC